MGLTYFLLRLKCRSNKFTSDLQYDYIINRTSDYNTLSLHRYPFTDIINANKYRYGLHTFIINTICK